MGAVLDSLEAQALTLSREERDELLRVLIESIDGEAEDAPEAIARAWDEEIERRVADVEAGRTQWVPYEEAMAQLRATIAAHDKK